jgi:hypothetical protein
MVPLLGPGERHWEILRNLLVEGQAPELLVMDAHLAALAIEHGATLSTSDRDFARFPGLRLQNPLRSGAKLGVRNSRIEIGKSPTYTRAVGRMKCMSPDRSLSGAASFLGVNARRVRTPPKLPKIGLRVRPRHVDKGGRELAETTPFFGRFIFEDTQLSGA